MDQISTRINNTLRYMNLHVYYVFIEVNMQTDSMQSSQNTVRFHLCNGSTITPANV